MKAAIRKFVELAHGRKLEISEQHSDGDTIKIRGSGGELEVTIVITAEGPSLRLRALDLQIEATHAIRMRCETFDIETRADLRLAAACGGISIRACDDVDLKGERVLLNADPQPMPSSWAAFDAVCASARLESASNQREPRPEADQLSEREPDDGVDAEC